MSLFLKKLEDTNNSCVPKSLLCELYSCIKKDKVQNCLRKKTTVISETKFLLSY